MARGTTNGRSGITSSMRLTFVADSAEYGGAEVYVAQLLSRLPPRFEPTLLATSPLPAPLREAADAAGAPIVPFEAPRGKFDARRIAASASALRATRPDLVHLNLSTAANNRHLIGASVALGTPAVATLHIVAPILSRVQRTILGAAFRRLRRVIAVSEEIREQLCGDLRIDPRRVSVVHNGVERRAAGAGAHHATPRVGGLGRLTRQKGFDVLVEAVRILTSDEVQVDVVIGGDGVEREDLVARSRGLPVTFCGFVSDVGSFLADLDVFCLPSRWEGLPFALLEAMMAGLPCVASDVGDIAVALGDAGVLVAPDRADALAAALRELIASPDRRRQLGAAAHARAAANHTVEKMVADTVSVYREALA